MQELFIQQLQDEIRHMQLQMKGADHMTLDQPIRDDSGQNQGQAVGQLQHKLRMAAKHISQLAKEKQQLIEVGNRLRAALKKNGIYAKTSSLLTMIISGYLIKLCAI